MNTYISQNIIFWYVAAGVLLAVICLVIGIKLFSKKHTEDLDDEGELSQIVDLDWHENASQQMDLHIKEKTLKIQERLNRSKAKLGEPTTKKAIPIERKSTSDEVAPSERIKSLAGEITEDEINQDRKRREEATNPQFQKPTDPDNGKTTNELLNEFEIRNNIPDVKKLESDLIEYDSSAFDSFRK